MKAKATKVPLTISHDPGMDLLIAVECGSIVDGKLDDEYIVVDEHLKLIRQTPGGPVAGFVVVDFASYESPAHATAADSYRFDVPVLGLKSATPDEIVASARATFGA